MHRCKSWYDGCQSEVRPNDARVFCSMSECLRFFFIHLLPVLKLDETRHRSISALLTPEPTREKWSGRCFCAARLSTTVRLPCQEVSISRLCIAYTAVVDEQSGRKLQQTMSWAQRIYVHQPLATREAHNRVSWGHVPLKLLGPPCPCIVLL